MTKKIDTLSDFNKAFGEGASAQLSDSCIWTNFNTSKYLVTRYPLSYLTEPEKGELSKVFTLLNPLIISYGLPTKTETGFNTYFYYTTDKEYILDKLKGPQRRTTKKALRSFEFKEISWQDFQDKGYKCYKDARERNDLSDGDHNSFINLIESSHKIPSYKILAAIDLETGKLAATLIFNHIDRLITTIGHYSDNDFLINRPNNGLFHVLKEQYLVTGIIDLIEYGYSSIQESSNHESLDFFKRSIGFDVMAIDRKFIINPKYKLLFNPLTRISCKILSKILHKNKYLLKIESIFKII